ncbi:MAG: murein transglycosylase A [Alphaproteobacteria bacterium]
MRRFSVALLALLAVGCAETQETRAPATSPDAEQTLRLTEIAIQDLPGWNAADPWPALHAFKTVCKRFARKPAGQVASRTWPELGTAGRWATTCAAAKSVAPRDARRFISERFRAYQVGDKGATGLFTGYYEPEVPGSRTRGGKYQTPLYRKPSDIIAADLGAFSEKYDGKTVLGRVRKGRFVPYHNRAEIVTGALDGRKLELAWLADPVDAFFFEIQGSGRIRLEDGSAMRVGFAGKNGRPYRAIGRDLIERGAVRREDMSMQAIRSWLARNPSDAQAVMNLNRSFVFFQERKGAGPVGAAGTPLTAEYSLAIDPKFVPLGGLVFLDVEHPDASAPAIRRLVAAEDTGGAIKGAIRGDLFWGTGQGPGDKAGRMKSRGRYYILAPK